MPVISLCTAADTRRARRDRARTQHAFIHALAHHGQALCPRLLLVLLLASACGASDKVSSASRADDSSKPGAAKIADEAGEPVTPPFPVTGELEGLLLVWTDAEGQHSATSRSEIPEAHREHVRIDSLDVPPDKRLDPESVYVADLRAPRADGSYAVRKHSRAWLQAQVEKLAPAPEPEATAAAGADGGVTLYKTSWCGVCRQAAAYLRSREVAFVEKDVEKDPAAAAELQRKAAAAGKTPRGVPVIDFHGTLLLGYDQRALASLIERQPRTL